MHGEVQLLDALDLVCMIREVDVMRIREQVHVCICSTMVVGIESK